MTAPRIAGYLLAAAAAIVPRPASPAVTAETGSLTMPVSLPSVRATSEHRTVTLGELRDLVDAAEQLPDDHIVRGMAIPFKMTDLGHPLGSCMMALAIDVPESEAPPPQKPNRATRRGSRGPRR